MEMECMRTCWRRQSSESQWPERVYGASPTPNVCNKHVRISTWKNKTKQNLLYHHYPFCFSLTSTPLTPLSDGLLTPAKERSWGGYLESAVVGARQDLVVVEQRRIHRPLMPQHVVHKRSARPTDENTNTIIRNRWLLVLIVLVVLFVFVATFLLEGILVWVYVKTV